MLVQVGIDREIGGQVPVVPTVVAAKENLVAARGAPGDPHGDGARLATSFGVANHLGTGDGLD